MIKMSSELNPVTKAVIKRIRDWCDDCLDTNSLLTNQHHGIDGIEYHRDETGKLTFTTLDIDRDEENQERTHPFFLIPQMLIASTSLASSNEIHEALDDHFKQKDT